MQKRLEELGHTAKKSLGQNFLVSDLVIEKILRKVALQVELQKAERLIEIGPGLGALTEGLLESKTSLQLIEMDQALAAYWRGRGCQVLEADALQIDWNNLITPGAALVSNLPYQISSSIVIERSLDPKPLAFMVLMFQKEVAQRIQAPARRDDYGMLSVMAQNFWEISMVSEAGPKDFYPPPKIASRVLFFKPLDTPITDRPFFLKLVKEAFKQRRKLLKSNLRGFLHDHRVLENDFLDWLGRHDLKETARAEELSPKLFKELYEYIDHSRKQARPV
jgi:16S rRNA (adenine1518-N6/adenine1519-N6)-dimethyltransferase